MMYVLLRAVIRASCSFKQSKDSGWANVRQCQAATEIVLNAQVRNVITPVHPLYPSFQNASPRVKVP